MIRVICLSNYSWLNASRRRRELICGRLWRDGTVELVSQGWVVNPGKLPYEEKGDDLYDE